METHLENFYPPGFMCNLRPFSRTYNGRKTHRNNTISYELHDINSDRDRDQRRIFQSWVGSLNGANSPKPPTELMSEKSDRWVSRWVTVAVAVNVVQFIRNSIVTVGLAAVVSTSKRP